MLTCGPRTHFLGDEHKMTDDWRMYRVMVWSIPVMLAITWLFTAFSCRAQPSKGLDWFIEFGQ